MRKKKWLKITLLTLAACAVAGIILAVILFNANPARTSASASIQFSFKGAAEGVAPNGYRFDLNGFTSEEVLGAALTDTGLQDKYTTDQIRENLLVSGVYPENIVQQMTGYESLLTGDAGKVSAADYHATLYSVTLYNDFDKSISRENLEKILANIMTEFRTQFEKTYSVFLAEDSLLANLTGYDYPQQLELLQSSVSRYESFAKQLAEEHSDFLEDGEGFADIAVRYEMLRTSDLERLSGIVTMNALSVDQDRIVAQYENQIKVLEIQLKELAQEAKDTEELISRYNKDDIIYVSTAETLQQVSGNSTQTYDTLVDRRRGIEESIADKNKELAQIRLKLSDIRGEETTNVIPSDSEEASQDDSVIQSNNEGTASDDSRETQKSVVEKGIASAVKKLASITDGFSAMLKAYSDQEMNDGTVAILNAKYTTPKYLSGSFIKQLIMAAGPICALGLMVCLFIMVVSRWKEDKKSR